MRPYLSFLMGVLILSSTASAGVLVPWGNDSYGGVSNAPDGNDFCAISVGYSHALALRTDGTVESWVYAWGCNPYGQCDVPEPNNDFVAVAAGRWHSAGLKSDGSVVCWGRDDYGQCNTPNDADYIGIAVGRYHTAAIKSDGSLDCWGLLPDTPNMPPAPTGDFVAVAGGAWHTLALDANGSLVQWGPDLDYRLCGDANVPEGNFVDIAVHPSLSWTTNYALRDDGRIFAWGCCSDFLCDIPDTNGFRDVGPWVAIDANGSLTAWNEGLLVSPPEGNDPGGEDILPDGNDFVQVACSHSGFAVALTSDKWRTLTINAEPNYITCAVPTSGSHDYYSGQIVRVDAPRCPNCPATDKFDHWEGDVEDPNQQSQYLSMTCDRTITAVYVADERVCGDECHPILQGDLNRDCYVDMMDFAIYAEQWLSCTHPDCD